MKPFALVSLLLLGVEVWGQQTATSRVLITFGNPALWKTSLEKDAGPPSASKDAFTPTVLLNEFRERLDASVHAGESLLRITSVVSTNLPEIFIIPSKPFEIPSSVGKGTLDSVAVPLHQVEIVAKNLGDSALVSMLFEDSERREVKITFPVFSANPESTDWDRYTVYKEWLDYPYVAKTYTDPWNSFRSTKSIVSWLRLKSISIKSASLSSEEDKDWLFYSLGSPEEKNRLDSSVWHLPVTSKIDIVLASIKITE